MSRITVVGLDGHPLGAEAREALDGAELVVGGRRHLDSLGVEAARAAELRGDLSESLGRVEAAGGPVVVLASGDPGFFGIVRLLGEWFGLEDLRVVPAVSSVALSFARAGLHWDDAVTVSAHGRNPAERRRAVNVCRAHPKVAVLTGPAFGPAELVRELEDWGRTFFVAERLGEEDERVFRGDAAAVAGEEWRDPNVVLVLDGGRLASRRGWSSSGVESPGRWALPEDAFAHRSGMITKWETRALVLSRLGPGPGDLVWDVGAGSGSVAIECARLGAAAIAVERDGESCDRIHENAARHGVCVRVVEGEAPGALENLPEPDAVFVGGSGGGFGPIVELAIERARRCVVLSLVSLERVVPAAEMLEKGGFEVETTMQQASRMKGAGELHMLSAGTPVFVVSGGANGVIGLVAATENGRRNAAHLAQAWPDARLYEGKPKEVLREAWNECDGVVLFLATGAAVRLVAPLLEDKRSDPGVVCVDDAARFAVALAGGHGGGANDLAARVADSLGATPVVTTASDAVGAPSLDSLGADLGFKVGDGSDLAAVGAALVSGETVNLVSERRWPLGPLPENLVETEEMRPPLVLISDRTLDVPRPSVVYRPPSLAVGVGCSRGASAEEILGLIRSSLEGAELSEKSVAVVASVDAKRDEAGLLEAAERLGVPLRFYSAQELSGMGAPNPSEVVRGAVGTPSVAEASVLAQGAELILEKRKSAMATVAVGRLPVRGRLSLVSLGPGDDALLPPLAREALASSALVVGLGQYVDRVRHLLRPGVRVLTPPLGDEVERARLALAEARAGGSAALVSGGDVGVYAMASPALELLSEEDGVDVVVVPGVTAAQAAASLLGSPLGHDHCSLSLSDLLTPWEAIERRVEAAAVGDFVVSFYNPRSRGRDWQLGKAREILLRHRPPDTPVGIVKDAYRPTQGVRITDLASLRPEDVDMLTVVIVGSSQTQLRAGKMVTPRGYNV